MFFVEHATTVVQRTASGACVSRSTFDDFIQDKFAAPDEAGQPVRLAGVSRMQLNDAEMALEDAMKRTLNPDPATVALRYRDRNHGEQVYDAPAVAAKPVRRLEPAPSPRAPHPDPRPSASSAAGAPALSRGRRQPRSARRSRPIDALADG